ncbi:MAG: hypothetical protein CO127_07510 [Ignavibacteria bacterium CG_4_9_14_3_um_filter_36_18]|nr:MAG: hypothetical protein CO127_07510 [Ignavibacteria bacterium CG_4_9_14_3_um_filter_36_18]
MRILIYKRTHPGDPNLDGEFGINDCMGQIREFNFDAVIGVGGKSAEPQQYGISHKINWVGIGKVPNKNRINHNRAKSFTFNYFLLLENQGPHLQEFAPELAKRFYSKNARYVLKDFTIEENKEAENILEWSKNQNSISKSEYKSIFTDTQCSNKNYHNCKCNAT